MKKNNQMIITMILVLIVGAGAFFGGIKYQESKSPAKQFGNGQRPNGTGGQTTNGIGTGVKNGNNGRQIIGEILSKDDKSITVKLTDGSSRIILLSGTTTVNKAAEATQDDLIVGTTVAVFGTENTDKSVTAATIQVNPSMKGIPQAGEGKEQGR